MSRSSWARMRVYKKIFHLPARGGGALTLILLTWNMTAAHRTVSIFLFFPSLKAQRYIIYEWLEEILIFS